MVYPYKLLSGGSMSRYIGTKMMLIIPTLIGITLLAFILLNLAPSDPALISLSMDGVSSPSLQEIENKRHELGLDLPLIVQYKNWICSIVIGDWGVSYITRKPVIEMLLTAAKVTVLLSLVSILFTVVLAIPIGAFMAQSRFSRVTKLLDVLSIAGTSVPTFWLAIISIHIFAENLGLFPTSGYGSFRHLLLPAIILAIPTIASVMRIQRDAMLKIQESNYVLLARAKGLPNWVIVYKYMIQNALVTSITIIGNHLRSILGGAIIIETIFSLPGFGVLLLQSIQMRDYPVIQGYVLIIGIMTIMINVIIDIIYVWLQPSIRLGRG